MNAKDAQKAEREREIFAEFAHVAALGVNPSSIESLSPPDADIRCRVGSLIIECEMGEIADTPVARTVAESIKTGEPAGAAFSQDEPLHDLFLKKALRRYRTVATPLILLTYYDKQYPPEYDLRIIPDTIGEIAENMVSSHCFDCVFVYDTWKQRLLWRYPLLVFSI